MIRRGWPWVSLLLRTYLGTVFIMAAISKIADPVFFLKGVHAYGLLPMALLPAVAVILPWLELLAGALLLLGLWVWPALLIINGLLLVFTLALVWALQQKLAISCACFDLLGQGELISVKTLLRDIVWFMLSLTLWIGHREPLGLKAVWRYFSKKSIQMFLLTGLALLTCQTGVHASFSATYQKIDLTGVPYVGSADARHQMVVYACFTCPFCRKEIPSIKAAVESGALKGQYAFYWKLWPLMSHQGSFAAAEALMGAHAQQKFWPYFELLAKDPEDISLDHFISVATTLKLDIKRFTQDAGSDSVKQWVQAAKQEGYTLGVKRTPTFFVDGYEYTGKNKVEALLPLLVARLDHENHLRKP